MTILPFNYYVEKSCSWCPSCTAYICAANEIVRTICKGGLFKKCPKYSHFHRKCRHCDNEWVEMAKDSSPETQKEVIKGMLKSMDKASAKELVNELTVTSIMEE